MCILKKTDGPCVKGPGTGGRASQTVAHAVEVRSKHGFGNAPRGQNALTDGRKRVWRPAGAGEDCGEKLQQAAAGEPDLRWAGPDLPACRKSRAGEDQGEGQGEGRSRREGPFPLRQGLFFKEACPQPCLLRQETAGDTGSHGHPKLLPLSPSSLRARAAAVPCGCGSRAEGLLPERHRSRLPGRVPV